MNAMEPFPKAFKRETAVRFLLWTHVAYTLAGPGAPGPVAPVYCSDAGDLMGAMGKR